MVELNEREIRERIRALSGPEFERFVAALWELQGWTTEVTDRRGDRGRDIIARRNFPFELTLKIEAKAWNEETNISSPTIRQYSILPGDEADHAVVVTSSSFTGPAKQSAEQNEIKLVGSTKLVKLVQKLGAEPLLTDDVAVDDWEHVRSAKHLDWTVDTLGESESVEIIQGIGQQRADVLATAGIHTVADLVVADVEQLVNQTPFAESRLRRWINLAAFHRGSERPDVIDGVGQEAVEKLSKVDIYTADELQTACPKEIAAEIEIDERTLKQWVGDAAYRDVTVVTELPRIGSERARELAKADIFTVDDLAEAEPEDVANQTGLSGSFGNELIQQAQTHQ
ncbi:DUF4332 domain-containing protein [Halovenus sp. HT40]|uniref:DUF4332 domain-containing protein n=1 Tax=Halovenus sp. HT40 TaxID=3126691 RepID=UPI00300EC203